MKLLTLLLMLVSTAHAEVTATVALGKKVLEKEPFERAATIGYKAKLSEAFFIKPQVGGWLGGSGKQSWFVMVPVGVQAWVPNSGAYATVAVGPARISQPDHILGGKYQFGTEASLGLKDERVSIAATWFHFSSGGLALPNLGRDFLGVQIGVSL